MVKSNNNDLLVHDPLRDGAESKKTEVKQNIAEEVVGQTQTIFLDQADALGKSMEIGECLTISEVNEVVTRFRSLADLTNVVYLDATNLSRIDGAGVQLLCAIFKEAENQQMDIGWIGEPELVASVANQMGVLDLLGLTMNK